MDKDEDFVSLANRYIFILLETDGRCRADLLGITRSHYYNKELAKEWKTNIEKEILSYKGNRNRVKLAIEKLNSFYKNMICD